MLKEAPEMRDVILFAYTVMSRIMTEHDGICILRNMFVTGCSFVYFATSRHTEKMRHSGMGCRNPDSVHGIKSTSLSARYRHFLSARRTNFTRATYKGFADTLTVALPSLSSVSDSTCATTSTATKGFVRIELQPPLAGGTGRAQSACVALLPLCRRVIPARSSAERSRPKKAFCMR